MKDGKSQVISDSRVDVRRIFTGANSSAEAADMNILKKFP